VRELLLIRRPLTTQFQPTRATCDGARSPAIPVGRTPRVITTRPSFAQLPPSRPQRVVQPRLHPPVRNVDVGRYLGCCATPVVGAANHGAMVSDNGANAAPDKVNARRGPVAARRRRRGFGRLGSESFGCGSGRRRTRSCPCGSHPTNASAGAMLTAPSSDSRSPARIRSSVLLPAPLAPTTPTTSPGATVTSSPSKRVRWANPPATFFATSVAVMGPSSHHRAATRLACSCVARQLARVPA
jgi:hypothetical protein